LAILIGIALALLVTLNRKAEAIFLPLFDILESVPVLAFFPVLIIFFIKLNYLNGAAIFIIFLAMLWNIVFTVVGGLKIIPREFKEAATIFGVRGWSYFRKIILPAIFPELVTGSILAVAQGWNITIVAEVLHVYIPGGNPSQDLFGIGNILVRAASTAQTNLFIAALVAMVLMIAILNFFVWQKLLRYAERFKFE
jgi:NitT/TauT family transport system permease protein